MNNIKNESEKIIMTLPKNFCWTKFGVEAGEGINSIIQRKEHERLQNDGIFLWGVGNALGPSIINLIKLEKSPRVVFSPIKSNPKAQDVNPDATVAWTCGETLDGKFYNIPKASFVTSRWGGARKTCHYALVCKSKNTLELNNSAEKISFQKLKNLRSGNPLGYSQVTSVVTVSEAEVIGETLQYSAAMVVELVYPYFVKLHNPIQIPAVLKYTAEAARLSTSALIKNLTKKQKDFLLEQEKQLSLTLA